MPSNTRGRYRKQRILQDGEDGFGLVGKVAFQCFLSGVRRLSLLGFDEFVSYSVMFRVEQPVSLRNLLIGSQQRISM